MDVPVIMLEFQQVQVEREVEGASDSAHRRSAGHSSCVAETSPTVLQVQFLEVVDMPVVVQRQVREQVPQIPVVEKTDDSHSCSSLRKSLRSLPVLGQGCCMPVGVQQQVVVVPVQKTAEVPHMQFIDKVVAIPVDNLLIGGYGGDEGFIVFF